MEVQEHSAVRVGITLEVLRAEHVRQTALGVEQLPRAQVSLMDSGRHVHWPVEHVLLGSLVYVWFVSLCLRTLLHTSSCR